ncbi:hypothetical protein H5410_046737 [Solanum commersonii]|uniref:Retrotransposon gag protein n=1 Tax=Solanum commersonii TaxID=4109 RepID=A0A9J5XF93_SOLCO|nr:hypothetical protein H5410_046737 [Solanum commersonii]
MEKSKLDALQLNMHELEKKVNEKLNSKPTHDLRYKKLCVDPRVELSSRFKIPKFNMFDGNMSYDGERKLSKYVIHRIMRSWSKTLSRSFNEYGIQSRRIIDEPTHLQVLKNSLDERNKDASTSILLKQSNQNTEQPREGWIPKHSSLTLDLSKNCVYHSNIQGHDTEECPALRNKLQNMIEKGKNIVQQGPLNNNCNPSTANAVIVQGDPTEIYLRPLTQKRKPHQRKFRWTILL